MSMKKNALAVALVAGLGMAGTASAYLLYTAGDKTPERVATADITSASSTITMTQEVQAVVESADFIVGRTTGFNVRISLLDGARFTANSFSGDVGPAGDVFAGDQLPTDWTVALAAGGGAGDSFAVFNVQPPTTGAIPGIVPGEIVGLSNLQLTNLTTLQTSGNQVRAQVDFIDPVGASSIGADTSPLLESGNPVTFGCNPNAGEVNERIDVGVTSSQGSKTYFSSTGAIGGADNGLTNLGAINQTVASGFSFNYAGTDSYTTVVSGNFGAFFPSTPGSRGLFLSSTSNCASPITTTSTTVNSGETQVTFVYTGTQAGYTGTGGTLYLCGQVPAGNTEVIDATTVSAITTFNRTGVTPVNSNTCALLPLQYNGSVVKVYHVNPAGNSTAQSFIRVINPTGLNGRVSITAVDDAGVSRGPITMTLNAQQSVQINSNDLEAGNAAKGLTGSLGDGTGKWRLFVTGEFAGMVVQSLNRNATDGTVTNLTDADTRDEQVGNGH